VPRGTPPSSPDSRGDLLRMYPELAAVMIAYGSCVPILGALRNRGSHQGSVMKSVQKLAVSAGAVTAAAAALFAVPAGASASVGGRHGGGSAGVVFAQNDGTAGNEVIAYLRTASGGLTQAGTYATGGTGGILDGSVVDHTAS